MADANIALWNPGTSLTIPANEVKPQVIAQHAALLAKREIDQIVSGFKAESYEMVSTFVWTRTMGVLLTQLHELGMDLIGMMLGRPDITETSDINSSVTPSDAIRLAEDLGMISKTAAMRLSRTLEDVTHFSQPDIPDEERMTSSEAITCLRACVEGVLGQQNIKAPLTFVEFRRALEQRSFKETDSEVDLLATSAYLFRRTTLSVLLSMMRTASAAVLEHASANVNAILPALWRGFRDPERWQVGQTYSEVSSNGRTAARSALQSLLVKVHGFDYVPETLRSSTYTNVANKILQAHDGFNNFYNEPAPIATLQSIGTTIPMPAFPVCMTAILSVRLGRRSGVSNAAQPPAEVLLKSLADTQWGYYLDQCLPGDRRVLAKLATDGPIDRWTALVKEFNLASVKVKDRRVISLLKASERNDRGGIASAVEKLLADADSDGRNP